MSKEKQQGWEKDLAPRIIVKYEIDKELADRFMPILEAYWEVLKPLFRQLLQKERAEARKEGILAMEKPRLEAIERAREEAKKMRIRIQSRLAYCQAQNGLPYCKNCGLSEEDLLGKIELK